MRIEIDFGEKCIHQNLKMHTKDQTGSIYILYKLWQTHHLTERSLSLSLMDSQMLDFFLKPGLCVSFSLYIAKFWHNIAVIENDTYGPQSRGEVALVYTAKRHLSMRMIHLLQLYLMENAKEDWMEHDKGLEMMVVRYFRQ